jgi:ATP-independent RNA helicase DbpA
VLILVPSRELALQIELVFRQMGTGFKCLCCYGGHPVTIEKNALRQPPAVWIGTPGRIAYHIRNGNAAPGTIHSLVLDEFDKSLELGFQAEMSAILKSLTGLHRRLLTSATPMEAFPPFVGLQAPVLLHFLEESQLGQDLRLHYLRAEGTDKLQLLLELICHLNPKPTLVFCNHRDAVERISALLADQGLVHEMFHGGMEQEDRERALIKFRNGTCSMLISTDLASRGLDIPEIEAVVHYQLPPTEEVFIHRNGRTARMHAQGTAWLLLAGEDYLPSYLQNPPEEYQLPKENPLPPPTLWETLWIGAGRKDKVNKMDIVGMLLQKGALQKDDLGRIEVLDQSAYVAVRRDKVKGLLARIKDEKIKGRKVRIAISK